MAYLFRATRARRPGMHADRPRAGRRRRRRVRDRPRGVRGRALHRGPQLRRRRRQDELGRDGRAQPDGHPRRPAHLGDLGAGARLRASRSSRSTPCAWGCSRASWACWASSSAWRSRRSCPSTSRASSACSGSPRSGCCSWAAGGNMPKAWATGEAEPWPTQQQLREQRRGRARGARATSPTPRARGGRGAPSPPPPGRPEPATARSRRRRQRAQRVEEEEAQAPLLSGVRRRTGVRDRHAVGVDRDGEHEISTSNREGISWKRAPHSQSGASSRRAPPPPGACSSSPARSRIPARWASPPSR